MRIFFLTLLLFSTQVVFASNDTTTVRCTNSELYLIYENEIQHHPTDLEIHYILEGQSVLSLAFNFLGETLILDSDWSTYKALDDAQLAIVLNAIARTGINVRADLVASADTMIYHDETGFSLALTRLKDVNGVTTLKYFEHSGGQGFCE